MQIRFEKLGRIISDNSMFLNYKNLILPLPKKKNQIYLQL